MKKSFSILLLVCMLISMLAGTGFTLRDAEGGEALLPAVEEEVPNEEPTEEAPSGEPSQEPNEEASLEEPELVSGVDALVPVVEEGSAEAEAAEAVEEAPDEDGLPSLKLRILEYLDADGTKKTASSASQVTADTTELTAGWWYVASEVTLWDGLTVSGDVHLILADGAYLAVYGRSNSAAISVNGSGNSLTIYAGRFNLYKVSFDIEGSGILLAHGGENAAGIGGDKYRDSGKITINGGDIRASGGTDGAGIGGGSGSSGSNITINGGKVLVSGGIAGAGIGGGFAGSGDNITINGGTVTVYNAHESSSGGGAGIGGGYGASGSNITIGGGTVVSNGERYGAGIGGGNGGNGSNITISGGAVTATGGGDAAAGIGGGYNGDGTYITINGGTVTATGKYTDFHKSGAAGIGGGYNGIGSHIYINGGTVTATGGCSSVAGIGGGSQGSAADIKIATRLTVKAGASTNPTSVVTNSGDDLSSLLTGKRYVTASVGSINGGTVSGTCGSCIWTLDLSIGHLTVKPIDGTSGTLSSVTEAADWAWHDYRNKIKSVRIESGVKAGDSIAYMFENCSRLFELDLSGLDTRETTNMSGMFADCSALEVIYVGDGWSTGAVESGNDMFRGCTSLVGGAGTVYDSARTDVGCACADGGAENPGYLTKIVAVVGSNEYATVQEAVTAAENDTETTVTMVANSRETVKVETSKKIILNLNGYVLDGGRKGSVIENNGTLTVTDTRPEAAHGDDYAALPAGGCITGGNADKGAGVRNAGELILDGGTITGNDAALAGGGVYTLPAGGFVTIGGKVDVCGNTGGGRANNLWIAAGSTVTVNSDFTGTVGVTVETTPTAAAAVPFTAADTAATEDAEKFNSDNSAFGIIYNENTNQLQLAVKSDAPVVNFAAATVTDTTISLPANAAWEYSRDGGRSWQNFNTFEGLTPATKYDFLVRTKATANAVASDPVSGSVYTAEKTRTETGKALSPKTGDDNNIILWGCLLSCFCGAAVAVSKKRKEK